MSSGPYQLLLRHSELLTNNTVILTDNDDLDPEFLATIKQSGSALHSWNWRCYQAASGALPDNQRVFGVPGNELPDNTERVILIWPKSKVLARVLVELLAHTPEHRYLPELWIAAANDLGGKSVGKALTDQADCEKHDSARHCSLWSALLKPAAGAFNWLTRAKPTHYRGKDYLSLPGVFSQGTLDAGTELLLQHMPERRGRILDLGCGSGIIGLQLVREGNDVTLSDVDAMALRSASLNSVRLGLSVDIVPSDGLESVTGSFDLIISNPPFHSGKETDYQIARSLFNDAARRLRANGELWIVANRHLPYEEWIDGVFRECQTIATGQGFKVLQMRP